MFFLRSSSYMYSVGLSTCDGTTGTLAELEPSPSDALLFHSDDPSLALSLCFGLALRGPFGFLYLLAVAFVRTSIGYMSALVSGRLW